MRKSLLVALLLAATLLTLGQNGASARPIAPCENPENATKSLDAPGTLIGTSGNDILFGSTGADVIKGKGGHDIICGNGGADDIDGGTGDDEIEAVDGSNVKGGAGMDFLIVSGWGGVADGGSGNDTIWVSDGATAKGNSGNDSISATGAAAVYGGSGRDRVRVDSESPAPYINCGSGQDLFSIVPFQGDSVADSLPEITIISCEQDVV